MLLYWDIGHLNLERRQLEGWGAKVIDRLAADFKRAFPDMQGFSPENLRYTRALAAACPGRESVQAPLVQITWYHHISLLHPNAVDDRLGHPQDQPSLALIFCRHRDRARLVLRYSLRGLNHPLPLPL